MAFRDVRVDRNQQMIDPQQRRPVRKSHRLAPSAYATTEYEYHFTVCARHQGSPFLNADLAKEVIDSLIWTKQRYGWLLFCYCLMPDHLHFLCRLTERELKLVNAGTRGLVPEGVLDHLSRFKSYTTNKSWRFGIRGQLWQKGSYDRVLDLDWPFEEVAVYILSNPVRRGLVKDWNEWEHSVIVDPWWSPNEKRESIGSPRNATEGVPYRQPDRGTPLRAFPTDNPTAERH